MMNSQNNNEPLKEDEAEATLPKKRTVVYRRPKAKMSRGKKALIWVSSCFGSLIAIVLVTAIILVSLGKASLLNISNLNINPGDNVSDVAVEDDGKSVTYGGKPYKYNENMTAILCMGIDREELADEGSTLGTNGQADAIFLFCMDTKTGKSTIIPIPRDTMVDIDVYSVGGKYVSSSKSQLCLSYAYGDGKHTSCENTVKSVSRLFYGLPINSYVAIDLEALDTLTNKIGGVKIKPSYDIDLKKFSIKAGEEYTLKGDKAREFVQWRDKETLDSSLERMSRQKMFIQAFFSKALEKTKKDISTPVSLYNAASKYMVTDLTVSDISFLTSSMLSGTGGMKIEFASISGEMEMGDKYAEYYVNENSVYNTVINVFYTPVQ